MKHLWEIDHPYYCNDANYLADYRLNHGITEFDSWNDFMDEFGDADKDYNLVFRWDWKRSDPDDYDEDETVPGDKLHIYYMMQRKGFFQTMIVRVVEEDEPFVINFLRDYAEHMKKIWEPLL